MSMKKKACSMSENNFEMNSTSNGGEFVNKAYMCDDTYDTTTNVEKGGEGVKNDKVLEKTMGLRQGFALMLGLILGSGIFLSPSIVANDTSSSGVMLIVWVLAGFLALMGSLCYCELGGIFKIAGGNYMNILKVYGRIPGFLCAWTTCIIIDPACLAAIALTIGSYLAKPFYPDGESEWAAKIIALVCIFIATTLNCMSSRLLNKVQSFLACSQIASVVFVVCVGIYQLSQERFENLRTMFDNTTMSSSDATQVGLALFGALWSYDGWSSMNNVVEEMKNVERDLLLTVLTAFPFVIISYVLVNISLLTILTHSQIASSSAVAIDFITSSFGKKVSYLMMALVGLSAYGTLNGSLFACARLTLAAAREGHMPKFLSLINKDNKTPIPGIVFASFISMLMLFPKSSDLNALILLFSQAQWIIYGSSIAGVIILRIRSPELVRPFKVWLIVPIIMTLVSITLVIVPFFQNPMFSLVLFAFILFGLPVYFVFVNFQEKLPVSILNFMGSICSVMQNKANMVPCEVNDL